MGSRGGKRIVKFPVDAFASEVFKGNQAAVCAVPSWPSDALMQSIARENNYSETAFIVKNSGDYELRWFTPGGEIDLCGHATLASGFVVLRLLEPGRQRVVFSTKSGPLAVTAKEGRYEMDLPAYRLREVPVTDAMTAAIGSRPLRAFMARDLVCVLPTEEDVRRAAPAADALLGLDGLLLHITAEGGEFDCVTRSFGPKLGVYEDPVCGSGHCHVVPYWAEATGKTSLLEAHGRTFLPSGGRPALHRRRCGSLCGNRAASAADGG